MWPEGNGRSSATRVHHGGGTLGLLRALPDAFDKDRRDRRYFFERVNTRSEIRAEYLLHSAKKVSENGRHGHTRVTHQNTCMRGNT